MASTSESAFQSKMVKVLKQSFPGCIVLKNDPNYMQGIPDWLILYKGKWAALEAKKSSTSSHRPNQDYYINRMNGMSYASFVYPENFEEVLHELQQAFGS